MTFFAEKLSGGHMQLRRRSIMHACLSEHLGGLKLWD